MCLNILIVTLAAVSVEGMPQFALQQPQDSQMQYVPAVDRIQQNNNYHNLNQNLLNVVVLEIESSNQDVRSEIVSNRRGEVSQNDRAYERNRKAGSAVSNVGISEQRFEPIPENAQQSYTRQSTEVESRNVQDSGFENTDVSTISKPYEDNTRTNYYDDSTSRNTRINEDAKSRSDPSGREPAVIVFQKSNKNPVTSNSIYNRDQSVNIDNSNRNTIPPYKNQYDNQITTNTNNNYDNDQRVSNDNLPQAEKRQNTHTNQESVVNEDPYAPGLNKTSDSKNNTNVNILNGRTGNDSTDVVENNTQTPGSRSGLDANGNVDEDRWVWNVTEPIITTTPLVEKRVSFDGGSCPTGKIRVAGQCVIVDT